MWRDVNSDAGSLVIRPRIRFIWGSKSLPSRCSKNSSVANFQLKERAFSKLINNGMADSLDRGFDYPGSGTMGRDALCHMT